MRTFDFWVLKLDSNGNIPGCDVISSEEVFVYDTSISGLDSGAIAQPSTATITNTSIVPFDRSPQVAEICNYIDPSDADGDGIDSIPEGLLASTTFETSFLASEDNCPDTPNGPYLGTCVTGDTYKIGRSCIDDTYCGTGGFCSMNQEDTNESGMGDACYLCEADFDCDGDCDGTDAGTFKLDFGRSTFDNPCNNESQCHGDFDCDNDCDGADAAKFKEDFGRSEFNSPCPTCTQGDWCSYP
jgi:hypothetical protein